VIPLDIRLLAATNRDLARAVEKGEFRKDLYHRLNVVTIKTPALRERSGDVMLLARHFLAGHSARMRRHVTGFSQQAEALLRSYTWPGNVRELENVVERAVILGAGDRIEAEDLPDEIRGSVPARGGKYKDSVFDARRESILQAYQQVGGDYKAAAKLLGIHPNYLLRLVRNLDLKQQVKGTRAGAVSSAQTPLGARRGRAQGQGGQD
jgi:DNA-binding NtrC family response regulator